MPIRSTAKPSGRKPIRRATGGAGNPGGSKVRSDSGDEGAGKSKAGRKGAGRVGGKGPRTGPTDDSQDLGRSDSPRTGPAEPKWYSPGFISDEWQDAGVRGRVFTCGLPGSGKSQLIVDRIRSGRRVVVFNTVNAETLSALQSDGFVVVNQPAQLREALARSWGGDFRIMYTPLAGAGIEHFEAVNAMVAKCGQMIYAVDEVDKYQDPGFAPPALYDLLNYARHYKIAMIGAARRPAQVSKEYTYSLSEICGFMVTEPGDLKYFESKCGKQAATILPTLGKYEYLRWQADGRIVRGKGW